ncbi:hypothetical protein OC846_000996 [Tilletia horrida]|uniref:Phospholipid-transporting ATPase n=1 Tax=Tilletia horrida TaxID=155126 RepID=A0AAN6GX56_9BASI|nr:hypothetical protein OC846_000996 [Tilletia horrida]KAK0567344.1 hypothetical protein OC861_002754 [Tilletia horrida]
MAISNPFAGRGKGSANQDLGATKSSEEKPSFPKRFLHAVRNIDLNPETAFRKKRPPPSQRSIYINEPLPSEAFDHKGRPRPKWIFATNQTITAKYTAYNFIFKNLLEQFRRVANCFFLLIIILQFFPKFYTISPGLAALPLLAVLALAAAKDGYEDIKRHASDRSINLSQVPVLVAPGYINPNITEPRDEGILNSWNLLVQRFSGKKKHQSEVIQQHLTEDITRSEAEKQLNGAGPNENNTSEGIDSSAPKRSETNRLSQPVMHHHGVLGRASVSGVDEVDGAQHLRSGPHWEDTTWERLAVGDFVLLQNDDSIPADILICATSEDENSCFIETKNLDGETNLKSRSAVPELAHLKTPADCARAKLRIDVEPQDTNMYRLNASVFLPDQKGADGNVKRCPVTLNQVLLRGCKLRNTEWVIGIVLMTGVDSKVIANSGNTPSKRGKVERQMQPMVYVNLALLAIMSSVCAIVDSRLEHWYFDRDAYWEFSANRSDDNPDINGLATFGNGLITFQNVVPISLYISIEFVRTVQAIFIYEDADLYYDKTERRTTARSWNLSDDLGQIEYIFSDKTGTLTQNLMLFRECNINGVTYHGDSQQDGSDATSDEAQDFKEKEQMSASPTSESARKRAKLPKDHVAPWQDAQLTNDLKDPNAAQAVALGKFFRCLALCHTVLTAEDEDGLIEYKAQSPDEQALVQAAADSGFVFCGREKNILRIQTPHATELEEYELLQLIEFSSARKRMSVIVRRLSDGKIFLFSKGADSVIFERSAAGQDELKEGTDQALEEFANKGLRTLCLGYRELDPSYYEEWAHRYHDATVAIHQRDEQMEELASEIETELTLAGSTAIEDRLQDGVPETIADLKRAGINIWVATGDKLETAIAIGYSTMLLSKDMNLIVVRGGEYGQPNSAYEQLKTAVNRFFGGEETLAEMEHQPPPLEEDGLQDIEEEDDGGEAAGRPSQHNKRLSAHGPRASSAARSRPSLNRNRSSRHSGVSHASIVGEDNGNRPGGYALVIDGAALGHALSEQFSKDLLLRISTQCKAVICCRVSPLQKALVVRLIKDGLKVITLAIGDGANDVSMIQAAHVGVGIAGEEGLQAVNASDYAIAQFRFLKRLLLVHGHWSYYRNSTMILNFFYKEIINIGYLFWFQIYCAWSTTQALDYIYLLLWNAFWTVAAVIGVGIFDRNISDRVLMEVPELYRRAREGKYFGLMPFSIYMLDGAWQSAVFYFFFCYTYDTTSARSDGYSINLYEWTTGMAMASVLCANLFTGLDTRAWTWWIVFAVFIGPTLFFIFAPIYAAFPPSFIWTYSYGNNHLLYQSAYFWFAGPVAVIVALIPRTIYNHIRQTYYPRDVDILRVIDKYDPTHDYIHDPRMPAVRAAAEYGVPLPPKKEKSQKRWSLRSRSNGEPAVDERDVGMHDLRPITSRSSTHHDMLTGVDRPNRGYSFSSDEPDWRNRSGSKRRRLSIRDRLTFRSLRRSGKKRLSIIAGDDDADDVDNADETGPVEAPSSVPEEGLTERRT